MTTGPAGHLVHLARRFVASVRATGPTADDEAFARGALGDAEWALWQRQRPTDRRHSVAVAREVQRLAGAEPVPPWVPAAALLHDVGKTEADLAVPGRVVAAVLKLLRVRRFPGRIGRYLDYPQTGAALVRGVGGDPRAAAWAAEHHEPPDCWSVPAPWAARLADADHRAV